MAATPGSGKISLKVLYGKYRKWFKALLITIAVILLFFVAVWLLMAWYISNHKAELLQTFSQTANEQLHGNLKIEDMEPALLKGFPNIAIELKGVSLSDSLYYKHNRNLFEFKSAYVKINVFSLLSKNPQVVKVTVADGNIHLFKDTGAYTNLYLFQKKDTIKKKPGKSLNIKRFGIENVTFTYDHFVKEKQLKFLIKSIDGFIDNTESVIKIWADTKLHIVQLGFNLDKGAFAREKDFYGKLKLEYNKTTKELIVPKQKTKVDDYRLDLAMKFDFSTPPGKFEILFDAPSINYKFGTSCLTQRIASKLNKYDFEDPIAVKVQLWGGLGSPDTPLVKVNWHTKNNILQTSFGQLSKVSMTGSFSNRIDSLLAKNDDNSGLSINNFSGQYGQIPIASNAIVIYGLRSPMLTLDLKSDFPLEHLNEFVSTTFNLQGGTVGVNLKYNGPVLATDNRPKQMNGAVVIKKGALTYINRGLRFRDCNLNIDFQGEDLHLKKSTITTKSSVIAIDGYARNFMTAYFTDPSKILFDWNIQSNQIDLNEFKSLLSPKQKINLSTKAQNAKVASVNNKFNQLLDLSSMHLGVNIGKVVYGNFKATNIKAEVNLTGDNTMSLRNVSFNHAGGSLAAHITLNPKGNLVPFQLNARVNKVAIDQLFFAFGSFGQETLTHENIKGNFSADINLGGTIRNNKEIIPTSVNGKLSFVFENGTLRNFQPFETIQKYAFKKRNLSHITFNVLKNELDIKHGLVTIPPMSIESSAITIHLNGIYGIDKGTDINMAIPLRNPQKDKELITQGKQPKKDKGIIVHLRAKDAGNGKVNIGWDPLKKGLKNDDVDE